MAERKKGEQPLYILAKIKRRAEHKKNHFEKKRLYCVQLREDTHKKSVLLNGRTTKVSVPPNPPRA